MAVTLPSGPGDDQVPAVAADPGERHGDHARDQRRGDDRIDRVPAGREDGVARLGPLRLSR